jgi:hypothetical protein
MRSKPQKKYLRLCPIATDSHCIYLGRGDLCRECILGELHGYHAKPQTPGQQHRVPKKERVAIKPQPI